MIKIIFSVVLLVASSSLYAQSGEIYYYRSSVDCYVKEYKLGELSVVSDNIFQGLPLRPKRLNRNPRFMAFKVKGRVFISPASCLKTLSVDSLDNLDEVQFDPAVNNSSRGEDESVDYEYYSRPISGLRSGMKRQDYYIELDAGKVNMGDEKSTYPLAGYQKAIDGTYTVGADTVDLKVTGATSSKYKVKNSFNLGFGKRMNENQFWSIRLKYYKGSSADNLSGQLSINGGAWEAFSEDENFLFKDTVVDILLGTKWSFFQGTFFRPFIAGFIGTNMIDSKFIDPEKDNFDTLSINSTSLTALAELGAEGMFTEHLGLAGTFGYQFIGKKTFKLSGKKEGEVVSGFKSDKSFSNTYINLGLRIYFN